MTRATAYSWIFLAVDAVGRSSSASLDKIIGAADALNHAIPTHSEFQTAIGWLMQEGLILQHGRDYGLTQLGRDLATGTYSKAPRPFDAWDLLKVRFASATAPARLADISETELQQAYDLYDRRAMEVLRKMGIGR